MAVSVVPIILTSTGFYLFFAWEDKNQSYLLHKIVFALLLFFSCGLFFSGGKIVVNNINKFTYALLVLGIISAVLAYGRIVYVSLF